jgi:hypothetical protein
LEEERSALLPLPAQECEARRVTQANADSLSLVRFDTNSYSVTVKYAHRTITVVATVDEVIHGRNAWRQRWRLSLAHDDPGFDGSNGTHARHSTRNTSSAGGNGLDGLTFTSNSATIRIVPDTICA